MNAGDAPEADGRETAPMQPYTVRGVAIGLLVLGIGLGVAYLVPGMLAAA